MKLLSIPRFSLLSNPNILNFRSKQGARRREELRSTLSVSDPSREHGAEKNFRSTLSVSDPSTAIRTPIQALRSKHADLPRRTPIHSLCLRWCVRVWVCLVLWCFWVILMLILWLIFDFDCGSVCIRGRSR